MSQPEPPAVALSNRSHVPDGGGPGVRQGWKWWAAVVAVLLLTAAAYRGVASAEFVNYDDPDYVLDKPDVIAGLTRSSLRWAFTTTNHGANWHPLTSLSHMLDCQLFGLDPRPAHVENVLWHLADTGLLLLLLVRLTGRPWLSLWAAALFALHPTHVESVAWISERKDVLSTFWGLATLLAYERYARNGSKHWKLAAVVCFILGLMAKPMLVTLPVLLLLLDEWPLGRRDLGTMPWCAGGRPLLVEKASFIVLAALECAVTIFSQANSGALRRFDKLPLESRVANAAMGYVEYLGMTLWPANLTCFYPHRFQAGFTADPQTWLYAKAAVAAMLAAAITGAALRWRRRLPYLYVGWLWYLVSLLPVIGLVQVGNQALADRYLYLPSIGLFVAFCWGVADLARWMSTRFMGVNALGWRRLTAFVAVASVGLCALLTERQVRYWHDSVALFEHALAVCDSSLARTNLATAHHNQGNVLARQGRYAEAEAEYRAALRVLPYGLQVMNHLANVLAAQGKFADASELYRQVIASQPQYAEAHFNWGLLLVKQRDDAAAREHFLAAVMFKPSYAKAQANLGLLLAAEGKVGDALDHFALAEMAEPGTLARMASGWRHADNHFPRAAALQALKRAAAEQPADRQLTTLVELLREE